MVYVLGQMGLYCPAMLWKIKVKLSCYNMHAPRLCSYTFLTLVLDDDEWSASHPSCNLPLGEDPSVHIGKESGWDSEQVWRQRPEEKSFFSAGDRTSVIQSVVRHYNKWAKPAPIRYVMILLKLIYIQIIVHCMHKILLRLQRLSEIQ
jgi:hypothetical protein